MPPKQQMLTDDSTAPAAGSASSPWADALFRVGPLTALPGIVRELGGDPVRLLAEAGFEREQLANPDRELSYLRASGLIAACVAATRCDHLGLLVGQRASASCLGIPGFLLETAPNVRSGLQGLARHLALHDRGSVLALTADGSQTELGFRVTVPAVAALDQINDLAMSVACRLMRSLCGERWNPSLVLLPRRTTGYDAPYREFFRSPLQFGADRCALRFPTRWLHHRTPGANPLLHRHLEAEADKLCTEHSLGLVGDVNRLLRAGLATPGFGATTIAGRLGMHERTLHRRLTRAGTSFRHEVQTARQTVAMQLLGHTDLPIATIAERVGYTDATAFTRAFRRWCGCPPSRWRTLHASRHDAGGWIDAGKNQPST